MHSPGYSIQRKCCLLIMFCHVIEIVGLFSFQQFGKLQEEQQRKLLKQRQPRVLQRGSRARDERQQELGAAYHAEGEQVLWRLRAEGMWAPTGGQPRRWWRPQSADEASDAPPPPRPRTGAASWCWAASRGGVDRLTCCGKLVGGAQESTSR